MKKQPKTKSVDDFFDEKLQHKSFLKAYREVKPLMDIAFAIVKARNDASLSQAELAKRLNTSQSVVSRIENGNQNLSIKMVSKIAKVLKCSLAIDFKSSNENLKTTKLISSEWG